MDAMLLSDQPALRRGLEDALAGLEASVRVHWSSRVASPQAEAGRTREVDVVFLDLAWCGMPALPQLARQLRESLFGTPLVLLLDHPDQVAQVQQACVDADLLLAKCAAPSVMRRTMKRFVGAQAA